MDVADAASERRRILHAFDEFLVQLGVDPARRHGVAANPVLPEIHRHRAGQTVQTGFRSTIGGMSGIGTETLDRPDIDDRSRSGFQQRQCRLDQQEGRGKIQCQFVLPVFE